jgi:hypothetical protein
MKELTSSGSDGLSDFLCFAVSLKTCYPDFWGMRAFLYNSDAVPLVVAPTISPEKCGADIFIWACLRAMRAGRGFSARPVYLAGTGQAPWLMIFPKPPNWWDKRYCE